MLRLTGSWWAGLLGAAFAPFACTSTFSTQQELVLYARALDDGERQSVESYLTSKWGCCGD